MKFKFCLFFILLMIFELSAQAKPIAALLKENYKYMEFARAFYCSRAFIDESAVEEWFHKRGLTSTNFETLDYLDGADDRHVAVQSYSFVVHDDTLKKIDVRVRKSGERLVQPSGLKISYLSTLDAAESAPLALIDFADIDCRKEAVQIHRLYIFKYKKSGWMSHIESYRGNGAFLAKTRIKPKPTFTPYSSSPIAQPQRQPLTRPLRTPKKSIAVGFLDTGFNYNLREVAKKVSTTSAGDLKGWDFFDEDSQPFEIKGLNLQGMSLTGLNTGHGTPVIDIAARGNEDIKILPYRVIEDDSAFFKGEKKPGFDYDRIISDAIERASAEGARIINLSLTFPNNFEDDESYTKFFYASKLHQAMKQHKDVLFVVAAGNSFQDIGSSPVYPASFHDLPNMLVVAGVDSRGRLYQTGEESGSNWSPRLVHVAALGQHVEALGAHGNRVKVVGTSFAAPFVTGIAAKMLLVNPNLSPPTIINIIERSVDKSSHLAGKIRSEGIANRDEALELTHLTLMQRSK